MSNFAKVATDMLARLELERAQLRSRIDTLPDLVWLTDPDGTYLACNELFGQCYDAPIDDILGRRDHDFTTPEQAEFFRAKDLAAIAAGKPTMNEEWITFASDGHRELLETIKTPMHDECGELIGVLGIGRNITERVEATERLHRVMDSVEALIVQLDRRGTVTLINRFAVDLLGTSIDEVIGRDWFEISCPPERASHYRTAYRRGIDASNTLDGLDLPLVDAHGELRAISWRHRFMCEQDGVVTGCLCAGVDITAKKREEVQLELAASVFDHAQEAIMVCDPSRNIMRVNPHFTRITGWGPQELLGQTWSRLVSERHGADFFAQMWRDAEEFGAWRGEFWKRTKSGRAYLANMTITTVKDRQGQLSHFVAML